MSYRECVENRPTTLNVSLPAELARRVREQVETGLYASASEVVREALRHHFTRCAEERQAALEEHTDRDAVRTTLDRLKRAAARQHLGDDLTLRDLLDEGRP